MSRFECSACGRSIKCAGPIKAAALVCRFCGNDLQPLQSHSTGGTTKSAQSLSPATMPDVSSGSRLAKPLSRRDTEAIFDDAVNEALGEHKTDT